MLDSILAASNREAFSIRCVDVVVGSHGLQSDHFQWLSHWWAGIKLRDNKDDHADGRRQSTTKTADVNRPYIAYNIVVAYSDLAVRLLVENLVHLSICGDMTTWSTDSASLPLGCTDTWMVVDDVGAVDERLICSGCTVANEVTAVEDTAATVWSTDNWSVDSAVWVTTDSWVEQWH